MRHLQFATLKGALIGVAALSICVLDIAGAIEPKAAGLNELVVYDPGRHERGLPAVEFTPTLDGKLKVDIPPAVHVHRYYYSGDKEFQGPVIPGGPTIVVANHPKTGQRMYVDAVLPAGAPKIAHNTCGITYVYPHQRVIITFSKWHTDKATVEYACGEGLDRRWHDFKTACSARTHAALQRSPLVQATKDTVCDVGKMALGAKDAAGETAANVINKGREMAHVIPGVTPLKSYAEQHRERAAQNAIQHETARREREPTEMSAARAAARKNTQTWHKRWLFGHSATDTTTK
ncbi:MAG TPA: hypothetical protein VG826_36265 [Pirellulales bacterium]|nr:hypothetical protein [Pirellulales bacterium]